MGFLHSVFNWITAHWIIVSTIIAPLLIILVAGLGNRLTQYYPNYKNPIMWCVARLTELLGCFTSKGIPGWWKWPGQDMSPQKANVRLLARAVKKLTAGPPVTTLLLIIAIAATALCSGCGTWWPRTCSRAHTGYALNDAPWTEQQCQAAQNKTTALLALTSVFGASSGVAGGIAAIIHDERTASIVTGAIAAAFAVGAAITAPFLRTAQANLSKFCSDWPPPAKPLVPKIVPASQPTSRPGVSP